ncbi:MFS transporter [Rhodovastum atsumiense]|uniref:MFS transporter n=1 Tax=Rhodovastum atsumiense TaxID=504468 RepID=A0A5M6IRV9_9PROT|nr:MFS transporter [Rhodovastum atsumiense]KAA5611014.1 MFS transporter [Rhodovastum atsumiense]
MDRPPASQIFETDIPARLDRLPWGRFHWLVVIALGITWILDGLEVTLVGSLSGAIVESQTISLTGAQIGAAASAYLVGAVSGALLFGWLTDRWGRKKLFTITVLVYLLSTIATGFAWDFWSFALFRALTGAGIGGEYAAVNATIQELIPARRRGFTDLVINGSFWLGAALGALGALVALDPTLVPPEIGWRGSFVLGGLIGFVVLFLRRWIPESPRWLMTHGHPEAAEAAMREIEDRVRVQFGDLPPVPPQRLRLRRDVNAWFGPSVHALLHRYRDRTILGTALMGAQAFCYNAVFFTYALILTKFYAIPSGQVGLFILPFAIGNFLGPLVLGRLFDTVGRRIMITATYALSGVLMAVTGWLFAQGSLTAVEQTAAWTGIFFVASAAASSAYLTVGESFPLEMRAVAIALFYALGTGIGGVAGPVLFGALIEGGSRTEILYGYLLGGGLMLVAAAFEAALGVPAERKQLEEIAPPLSAAIAEPATVSELSR